MVFGQVDAAWYDSHLRFYTGIALGILDERPDGMTDDALANEIHDWISAPDSLLQTWSNDGEDAIRAQCILTHSQHPDRPLIEGAELDRWQYAAAHVVVRDVMLRIGRTYPMPDDLSSQPALKR